MALFGKNKGGGTSGNGFRRDPRKARRFFEHAQTTADAGNYDYAIEMYVSGLRFDPDNMEKHEALYDVGKRRKVKGGKPAGLGEKMKSGGSHPIEKMLHAEKLWAMDILNITHMVNFMKFAVEANDKLSDNGSTSGADGAEEAAAGRADTPNLGEVAYWIGKIALENHVQSGKVKKGVLQALRDNFAAVGAFDKAVEACRYMVRLDPDNSGLLAELKNLEAENTMQQGGYSDSKAEEGGYRNFVRDAEGQRALEQEATLRKTGSQADDIIARRRAEHEEDPEDQSKLVKLVDALAAKESNESEKEAIEFLRKLWQESGTYRFKMRMGDIQIKQINRYLRQLRAQIEKDPENADLKQKQTDVRRKQLAFELKEYDERAQNYPTDLSLRFELGKRLHRAGKFDDAISAFQQARQDPKVRPQAYFFLGDCYLRKEWIDEAIDSLREGIEAHKIPDDRLALDLRYLRMDALERSARTTKNLERATEARELASEILRTDINFRDIKMRLDALRALVNELQS